MAIIWIDGPDHYGTDASLLVQGAYAEASVGLVPNAGPGGVGTVFTGSGIGGTLRWVLPGERDTVGIGIRVYLDALPVEGEDVIMQWRDASNGAIATLTVTTTGALHLTAGAINVTTAPVIVSQSHQHIETRLKFDAGNGNYAVNVSGLPLISSDGVDTGSTDCAQIVIAFRSQSIGGGGGRKRDLFVWDSTGMSNNGGMQGDRQVITSMPNGDGAEQDWQYSSGTQGYPLIDSVPPVDSDFVFADTAGNKSTFDTADISTDITSISAIRIAARAAKSDAGIGTMALNIVHSGDTAEGVEQPLSTEFVYYSQVIEKDPHTGTNWTPANLNAAQVELERIQ